MQFGAGVSAGVCEGVCERLRRSLDLYPYHSSVMLLDSVSLSGSEGPQECSEGFETSL